MRVSRIQLIVLLGTFTCTVLGYFLFDHFYWARGYNFHQKFYTQGYSFRALQAGDEDFIKYRVGEKIDLSKLRKSDGSELLASNEYPLILLAVLDPLCGYCRVSQDIMSELRVDKATSDIGYFPVLFTSIPETVDFVEYSKSIGFSDALKWEKSSHPPDLFAHMPTPAHILVDRNGSVLQVWFSSSRNEEVRKRMASQISSDINLIKDLYSVVAYQNY